MCVYQEHNGDEKFSPMGALGRRFLPIIETTVSNIIYSKKQRNETEQTVQFKLEDTMFFRQDDRGHLHLLPINALYEEIFSAYGATLKLDNQKMDGK